MTVAVSCSETPLPTIWEVLGELNWTWRVVDGMMGKARLSGEKRVKSY